MSVAGPSGSSGPTNRTIDDEQGDSITGALPTYTGSWNYGPECTGCLVQPDASRAHDNSWHDTTIDPPATDFPSVTLTFTGTAIYAFGIVPNTIPFATTFTNATFTLDAKQPVTFSHTPDATGDYLYNVNMFSQTGLANKQHTLKIVPQAGTNGSYLAFDYAIYTFDDTPSTTSASASRSASATTPSSSASSSVSPVPARVNQRSVPVGAIVGGVSAVVVFAVLALLFFLRRRRRRAGADRIRSNRTTGDDIDEAAIKIEPFQPSAPNAGADLPDLAASEPLLSATGEHPPMSEWSAGRLYGTSAHGSQPSLAVSAAPGASAFALSPNRAPASTTNGDVTHSDDSPRPSQTFGGAATATRSPAVSAIGRNPAPRPGTKAAMRQEELSRRLQEMEQHVADLNAQRVGSSVAPSSSVGASSRSGGSSSGANEEALRTQVEALQAEVERLRTAQQQQAMWEVGTEPPPAYEGRREAGPAPPRREKEMLVLEHGEAEEHPHPGEVEDTS